MIWCESSRHDWHLFLQRCIRCTWVQCKSCAIQRTTMSNHIPSELKHVPCALHHAEQEIKRNANTKQRNKIRNLSSSSTSSSCRVGFTFSREERNLRIQNRFRVDEHGIFIWRSRYRWSFVLLSIFSTIRSAVCNPEIFDAHTRQRVVRTIVMWMRHKMFLMHHSSPFTPRSVSVYSRWLRNANRIESNLQLCVLVAHNWHSEQMDSRLRGCLFSQLVPA